MSGPCKDCRYWRERESEDRYVGMMAPVQEGWRYCTLTEMSEAPQGRAVALDGEDYFAVLHTAPDFGCVEFEAKA